MQSFPWLVLGPSKVCTVFGVGTFPHCKVPTFTFYHLPLVALPLCTASVVC